jgi:hypothetical protein
MKIEWSEASTKRGIIWVVTAVVGTVFVFMGKPVDQLLLLLASDLQNSGGSANVYSGQLVITRLEGYLYTIAGQVMYSTIGSAALTTGYKTFSGDISQLQLRMSTGADTFNGGSINVMYE